MPVKKIDSNTSGLRIAYEDDIGVLPENPVFYPLEPNSYPDFGVSVKTTPRAPISQSRQRKKGFVTDLDATGGFNQDLTQNNLTRHLQGFFFAEIREKATTAPMNGAAIPLTSVSSATGYAAAAGLDVFKVNNLVTATGFAFAANNGLKVLTAAAAGALMATGLVNEAAPPAGAKLEKVGHRFAAGDITFTMNGNLQRMVSTSNALVNALGLIPGEWVYIGGDDAQNKGDIVGWARASIVTAGYIEFDKTDWAPKAYPAAGKLYDVYVGSLLRTEDDPDLQKRITGTLERTLGNNGTGVQAEYISGACANTLAVNMPQADKITMDLGYIAIDGYSRSGVQGLIDGVRPDEPATDAFNTSSDFSRIKLSLVDPTSSNVTPLFAYLLDMSLNISNNVTPNKALGTLGAIDTTAGMFTADGSLTAYFVDTSSTMAVRNNSDVTLDIVIAKDNAGMVFDLPLISLGNGINKVEVDQPITVPLDMQAAQSKFGHTMVYQNFPYVPSIAQ